MKPGIYVHLPFCRVHCSYCDFPLTTRLALQDAYYDAMLREIEMHRAPPADTLYFGGGTPSVTPVPVLRKIRSCFQLDENAELTLEANPDDVDPDTLAGWKDGGITRLSLGIQSLEDLSLRMMLRRHTANQALESIRKARHAGFRNINVDLILGAPGQTAEGFHAGLERLIELSPEHFSIYMLEIHEGTLLEHQLRTGKTVSMADEQQVINFAQAVARLKEAGYRHYEVSNFARSDFESRHNLKYWSHAPYFAYGAGACSYHDSQRIRNFPGVTAYIDAIRSGNLPQESVENENRETETRNALIFGLRQTDGIHLIEFEQEFGIPAVSLFPESGKRLLEEGFLEIADNRLRLTFSGMLVSNEILIDLV